jgi:membrane protein
LSGGGSRHRRGRDWSAAAERATAAVRRGRFGVVARALRRYLEDGMIDRAPALAYYGILSLFPLLLIAFSLVRLVGGADAPEDLASFAERGGASGAVGDVLRSAGETARAAASPAAGLAGLIGVLTLVYGGSRAFTATGRALDVIARRPSTSRSLARRAQDIGWTLVLLVLVLVLLVCALVSGRVLEELLDLLGLGERLSIWTIARWPAIAVAGLLIVAVVRWAAPTGARPPFRLATPGALVSVAVLIVATIGYDVYVTSIATYNTTYGAFAGAIILMLWIWLAAIALLLGAELDAALAES